MRAWTSFLLLMAGLCATEAHASKKQTLVGRQVADFTLQDFRGQKHSLSDFKDSKFVVLAVLGTECPLAKLYGERLGTLARKYTKNDVTFLGLMPNVQDSVTEIGSYARRHKIDFPLLKDLGNKVADAIGAKRTPVVYVLDEKRRVRYHGRIDNQYGVGFVKDKATKHHLKTVLSELVAGKQVTVSSNEAIGCLIGRVRKSNKASKVTYSNQIARIFQKRCVECHRPGEIAPFALTNYKSAKGWAEMIAEVVDEGRMPPWHANPEVGHFSNDRSLTKKEKELIFQWVNNGAPQGDPKDMPQPRTDFVKGWQFSRQPDKVVPVKPYTVPSQGVVQYRYALANPKFKEDKWFTAAQVVPGNRAVVHHVLVFAVNPKDIGGSVRKVAGGRESFLVGYVPGARVHPLPKGMAIRIPAGYHLLFQIHYTPIGKEVVDETKLAFWFLDKKDVTHEVLVRSANQQIFRIPPGKTRHRVEGKSNPLAEGELIAFMPHMHVRGQACRYKVVYPDGKQKTILDVPHYDFNWQTSYFLNKRLSIPRGTRIHGIAHFDNSEDNLANPDPTKPVFWGEQTFEEMWIGYFAYAVKLDPKTMRGQPAPSLGAEVRAKEFADTFLQQFDLDKNGTIGQREVLTGTPIAVKLFGLHLAIDKNRDGELTRKELENYIMKAYGPRQKTVQKKR